MNNVNGSQPTSGQKKKPDTACSISDKRNKTFPDNEKVNNPIKKFVTLAIEHKQEKHFKLHLGEVR